MLFNSEYFNIDNTAFKKELTQKIKEFDFEKTIFNIIDLGRSPQEAGILDGYFSLFFVLVPSSLLKE